MKASIKYALMFAFGFGAGVGFGRIVPEKKLLGYFKKFKYRFINKDLNVSSPQTSIDDNKSGRFLDKMSLHPASKPAKLDFDKHAEEAFDNLVKQRDDMIMLNEKKEISNDIVESNNSSGSDSGSTWSTNDRDRVSKFLDDSEAEVTELIPDEVVVLDESDTTDNDSEVPIREISPLDFVKAVAQGQPMQSYVFEPTRQKFYWNFTEEPLTDGEALTAFGRDLLARIRIESEQNPVHWISPKYFYNSRDKIYGKVESGFA